MTWLQRASHDARVQVSMHSRSHKGDSTFKLKMENFSQTIQVRKEMAEGTNNLWTTRVLVLE
jgi:hypothetical protein